LKEQEERLRAAGAEKIYRDVFTGRKMDRPKLQEIKGKLQPGDTLIVTRLDRLGRSVAQASALITELLDAGVTINVLNLGILSNGSVSTLLRNVLLSFAQFERDVIIERTQEGKSIARQREGYRDGRPKKYSQAQLDLAMELLLDHSYNQVVEMTGISRATLAREKKRRRDEK
jgi:DNA invertase Pin-like site-specific DNA recombinase